MQGECLGTEYSMIMLSIEKCRTILMQENYELGNDEIVLLRDFLYQIASYQIECETNAETENVII